MGCSLFANYHFQMGVTAMGFAEDFGQCMILILKLSQFTPGIILKIETESPGGAVNTKISKQKYEETITLES